MVLYSSSASGLVDQPLKTQIYDGYKSIILVSSKKIKKKSLFLFCIVSI